MAQGSTGETMTITAKYEDGVFKPLEDIALTEGTVVEVRVQSLAQALRHKSRPIGDLAFFGIWKDHVDIGDSVEYVNRLRGDLRG